MASKEKGLKEYGSIEIYFAKKLANNDKKIRDRAIKRMRIWLSSRPGDSFEELDMMKLWKGLFYCMWFSDKPLVQEDLASLLAKLIHSLKDLKAVCMFVDAFVLTMGREWHGIDSLRLDKFYMLIRRVIREVFVYVQTMKWEENTVNEISKALFNGPCGTKATFPGGVIMFLAEIFTDELCKQIKEPKPGKDIITKLFDPFIIIFAHAEYNLISKCIFEEVFNSLLPHKIKDDGSVVEIDLEKFGSRIFEEGTKKGVSARKRKALFNLSKQFKEASMRIPKQHSAFENGNEDENKLMRKAKKRKSDVGNLYLDQKKRKKKPVNHENLGGKEIVSNNNTDSTRIKQNKISKEESQIENEVSMLNSEKDLSDKWKSATCKNEGINEVKQKLDFESSFDGDGNAVKRKRNKSKGLGKIKMSMKSKIATILDDNEMMNTAAIVDINGFRAKTSDDAKINKETLNNKEETKTAITAQKNKKDSRTSGRKKKQRKPLRLNEKVLSGDCNAKKKVIFELDKNAVTSISSLKIDPAKVFTPDQKPVKGVLKTPTPRRQASDFF